MSSYRERKQNPAPLSLSQSASITQSTHSPPSEQTPRPLQSAVHAHLRARAVAGGGSGGPGIPRAADAEQARVTRVSKAMSPLPFESGAAMQRQGISMATARTGGYLLNMAGDKLKSVMRVRREVVT